MTPARRVSRLLQQYGSPVKITSGEEAFSARAFVQPLRYKNKLYLGEATCPRAIMTAGTVYTSARPLSVWTGWPTVRWCMPLGGVISSGGRSR